MSMLTPPGMGGKYRITGNQYPRMRRPRNRRRIVVLAAAAVCTVGLLGWGTVQLLDVFTGGGAGTGASSKRAACVTPPAPSPSASAIALPKPGKVKVNIYNATTKDGLAKKTAEALEKRGFAIGEVDNAPAKYDKKVKESALLLGGPGAERALKLLGTHLAGARTDIIARHEDPSVDLMIGKAFTGLAPVKEAEKELAALVSPSPSPVKGC
ncbi:LytR C-terminal domain-containing protein [Streptomyces thermolineatus]|uniref:LytR C-terminal domain-containing protein n=1 Tax=Streptomyces thermolineatus TaxID=44033 RepID=A0ABN3L2Y8_9ACTN